MGSVPAHPETLSTGHAHTTTATSAGAAPLALSTPCCPRGLPCSRAPLDRCGADLIVRCRTRGAGRAGVWCRDGVRATKLHLLRRATSIAFARNAVCVFFVVIWKRGAARFVVDVRQSNSAAVRVSRTWDAARAWVLLHARDVGWRRDVCRLITNVRVKNQGRVAVRPRWAHAAGGLAHGTKGAPACRAGNAPALVVRTGHG